MAYKRNLDDTLGALIGFLLFVVPICLAIFIVGESCLFWLSEGYFPERDIFLLIANRECTDYSAFLGFWSGKNLCRVNYIDFTNLGVGTNIILNEVFNLNILWLFPFYWFSITAILNYFVKLRKAWQPTKRS